MRGCEIECKARGSGSMINYIKKILINLKKTSRNDLHFNKSE